jgi:hypothetical protein
LRCLLAAVSFAVMFTPDMRVSAIIAVAVALALVVCIRMHRLVAPPKTFASEAGPAGPATGDLAPVLAEAKRDIG